MKILICKTDGFNTLDGIDKIAPSRKEKIARLNKPNDKICSLVAGLMLSYVFGEKANKITVTSAGKPTLDGEHFSISHTDGLVCLAVAHSPVGIDCEKIKPVKYDIGAKYFSESENDYLSTLSTSEKTEKFFTIWTGKESVVKAIGCGITSLTKIFSLLPLCDGYYQANNQLYHLRWIDFDGYKICIASENIEPIELINLTKNDLLR